MRKIPGTRREDAEPVKLGLYSGIAVDTEALDVSADTAGRDKVDLLVTVKVEFLAEETGALEVAVTVGKKIVVDSLLTTVALVLK